MILSRFVALLCFVIASAKNFSCGSDCIDLYGTKLLEFTKDEYSYGSDGSQYPQLTCIEGDACSESYEIKTILCTNQGEDESGDVKWTCAAPDMYETMYLGTTTVTCNGYRYPEDQQYVYNNSCRLAYQLYDSAFQNVNDDISTDDSDDFNVVQTTEIGRLLVVIFIFLIILVVCACCNKGWGYYYPSSYRSTLRYDYIDEPIISPIGSSTSYGTPVVHNTFIQPQYYDNSNSSYQQQQQPWAVPGWYGAGIDYDDPSPGVEVLNVNTSFRPPRDYWSEGHNVNNTGGRNHRYSNA